MNMHINLILASEKRSASVVSPRFVLRLTYVLIPVLILLFGFLAYLQSRQLYKRLEWAQEQWEMKEPHYQKALQLKQEVMEIRKAEAEIVALRHARHRWTPMLQVLPEIVPSTIQLTQLQSQESLQVENSMPKRHLMLKLWGRTRGVSPEADVETLRKRLFEHPQLSGIVSNAFIPQGSFRADTAPDADRTHRIFQIHAPLFPRPSE